MMKESQGRNYDLPERLIEFAIRVLNVVEPLVESPEKLNPIIEKTTKPSFFLCPASPLHREISEKEEPNYFPFRPFKLDITFCDFNSVPP